MIVVKANNKILNYLEKLNNKQNFSYGLIIGQCTRLENIVIHFAKTIDETMGNNRNTSIGTTSESNDLNADNVQNFEITNINVSAIIDHITHMTNMISGCFMILGFFVCSSHIIFEDQENFDKLIIIINNFLRIIKRECYHCNKIDWTEKFIFNYLTNTQYFCRSFKINDITNGTPCNWNFEEMPKWIQVNTYYEIDEVFPINRRKSKIDAEQNYEFCLQTIHNKLHNSIIYVNGELLEHKENLDVDDNVQNTVQMEFCFNYKDELISGNELIIEYVDGYIKYSGTISSRIWIQTRTDISEIKKFIINDISHSLYIRIRLYFDTVHYQKNAYLFDQYLNNASISTVSCLMNIDVPPKRIYFQFHEMDQIQFTDYVFPDEDNDTVIDHAQTVLDVQIEANNIFFGVETFDIHDMNAENSNEPSEDLTNSTAQETTRAMYMFGIIYTLGVILLQFIWYLIF